MLERFMFSFLHSNNPQIRPLKNYLWHGAKTIPFFSKTKVSCFSLHIQFSMAMNTSSHKGSHGIRMSFVESQSKSRMILPSGSYWNCRFPHLKHCNSKRGCILPQMPFLENQWIFPIFSPIHKHSRSTLMLSTQDKSGSYRYTTSH